ncbi:hypothetical protein [Micromonospora sp. RTGN7]|uniref:hypothetical protein n=1 Tax=Micromonospora sp. RTGN7 TaxID=3016526 RepID=UPI0029FEEC33|nr:hypothetical protein [Micromonospora sp. RTGN7]
MTLPAPIAALAAGLPDDPADRARALGAALEAVPELQSALRAARADAVIALKQGRTWEEVGEIIGLHPARASQIARGVTGGTKRRPEPAA